MSFDAERLYALLPAIHRLRDAAEGEPLKALLALIAEQLAVLEEDLAQRYDDQFIETCAEWVVPYIGDLVGARGVFGYPNATFSQRAQVANTIAYRRRKGTATVLEQLAHDVTGWNACAVEYFARLATTQYLNHLRPRNLAFTTVRDAVTITHQDRVDAGRVTEQTIRLPNWETLEYAVTPFDTTARTVDVRRIASGRGKHNIANVGIHLWPIESFPVQAAPAFRVDARRYRFDPLGRDLPLFSAAETESEISHLATPLNVPMPLSRRVLSEYLATYYGPDRSLRVAVDTSPPSPPAGADDICVCDLSDLTDASGQVTGWAHMPKDRIAVDPVLGRIALPADAEHVRVDYHYGFVGRLGGGTYGRAATFSTDPKQIVRVRRGQTTIQAALNALAGTGGVVEIEDDGLYFETPTVTVPPGMSIELRAADEHRPVLFLDGELSITGGEASEFVLNGLWLAGGNVRVPSTTGAGDANRLATLALRHCTLSPSATPDPRIASPPASFLVPVHLIVDQPDLDLEIASSITGPLRVRTEAAATITDSIVDAGSPEALVYADGSGNDYGGALTVRNSTLAGRVRVDVLTLATNTIFHAQAQPAAPDEPPVKARRLQEGCVRFCYLPLSARVPRRYRCQPDQALNDRASELDVASSLELTDAQKNLVATRVTPVFTSLRFGDAAYGQLSQLAPLEIRQGADDEAEMGAYHNLYQPQRVANLQTRLDEYLRFGLEAGVFYAI